MYSISEIVIVLWLEQFSNGGVNFGSLKIFKYP